MGVIKVHQEGLRTRANYGAGTQVSAGVGRIDPRQGYVPRKLQGRQEQFKARVIPNELPAIRQAATGVIKLTNQITSIASTYNQRKQNILDKAAMSKAELYVNGMYSGKSKQFADRSDTENFTQDMEDFHTQVSDGLFETQILNKGDISQAALGAIQSTLGNNAEKFNIGMSFLIDRKQMEDAKNIGLVKADSEISKGNVDGAIAEYNDLRRDGLIDDTEKSKLESEAHPKAELKQIGELAQTVPIAVRDRLRAQDKGGDFTYFTHLSPAQRRSAENMVDSKIRENSYRVYQDAVGKLNDGLLSHEGIDLLESNGQILPTQSRALAKAVTAQNKPTKSAFDSATYRSVLDVVEAYEDGQNTDENLFLALATVESMDYGENTFLKSYLGERVKDAMDGKFDTIDMDKEFQSTFKSTLKTWYQNGIFGRYNVDFEYPGEGEDIAEDFAAQEKTRRKEVIDAANKHARIEMAIIADYKKDPKKYQTVEDMLKAAQTMTGAEGYNAGSKILTRSIPTRSQAKQGTRAKALSEESRRARAAGLRSGESFNPESPGYDEARAKEAGLTRDKTGHMGSVAEASPQELKMLGLPGDAEAYLLLKGRQHKTWDKAVAAEEARGFKVIKAKNGRYYSVKQ